MLPTSDPVSMNEWSPVSVAFGKQAVHFDRDDLANPILQSWRKRIYRHVERFLEPGDRMLELNAGTGIDAFYFAKMGCIVHATDLSTGMVEQMEKKMATHLLPQLSCQQISFEHLDQIGQSHFDFVFSNFGGLNCIPDLTVVARPLSRKLKAGAYLTWVIMPPVCPWEWLWLLKGKWHDAFRRFQSGGVTANLEGERFQTYYHSLSDIRRALGTSFTLVRSESLGLFSAPPGAMNFYRNYPGIYRLLSKVDGVLSDYLPFSRWGDHVIATFQKAK